MLTFRECLGLVERKEIPCPSCKGWGYKSPLLGNSKTDKVCETCNGSRFVAEDAVPVNAAGPGNVAGIGIGPQGEPGVEKRQVRKHKRRVRGVVSSVRIGTPR